MKKIAISITVKAGLAVALCCILLILPPLQLPSAAAVALTGSGLKSESQLRSEASLYDSAIRALSGIPTTRLDTPEDLRKALDILNRERPNLRFQRSKLAVIALGDSTFTSAVKKKVPDKQAAAAFARELESNRQAIFKLDGAESLKTRMQRSAESDAATLRRAAEKLKEAADRIRKARQAGWAPRAEDRDQLKVTQVGFSTHTELGTVNNVSVLALQVGVLELVAALVLIQGAVVVIIVAYQVSVSTFEKLFTEEGRDRFAECQKSADDRLAACVSASRAERFPLNITSEAECYVEWAAAQAICIAF